MKTMPLLLLLLFSSSLEAESLCFSPVKEKSGDKDTHRSFWQAFDYKVQVDDGPVIIPSETKSTKYEILTKKPLVKIILGNKVIESFHIKAEWLKEGRNCIYFENMYETWALVEKWQAKKLCSCN